MAALAATRASGAVVRRRSSGGSRNRRAATISPAAIAPKSIIARPRRVPGVGPPGRGRVGWGGGGRGAGPARSGAVAGGAGGGLLRDAAPAPQDRDQHQRRRA